MPSAAHVPSVLDLPVPTGKTALMQHLQTLVVRGNRHWVGGFVAPAKLAALAKKFASTYPILRNERGRAYDRSRGEATVHLVVYPGQTNITWWLLSSAGRGGLADSDMHDHALMKHAMDSRSHIQFDDYQLVYAHKEDARKLVDKKSQKTIRVIKKMSTWTWMMSAKAFSEVNANISREASKLAFGSDAPGHFSGLRGLLAFQRRRPLFSGVRSQVLQLHRQANEEWGRSRNVWLGRNASAVAERGVEAGQLRSIKEIVSRHLPKMVRLKVFGAQRLADLAQNDPKMAPIEETEATTGQAAGALDGPLPSNEISSLRYPAARRARHSRFVERVDHLAADLAALATDLVLEAHELQRDGQKVASMRSTNTETEAGMNRLDRLQAATNRLRGPAFNTFLDACKAAGLMVKMVKGPKKVSHLLDT